MKFNELISTVRAELVGTEVTGKFGTGKIMSITHSQSNLGCGFVAEIQFPTETKQLQLNTALKSGIISMPENKQKALQFCTEHFSLIVAAEREEEQKKRLEEQQKKEKEKAEQKYKEKIADTIDKANKLVHTSVDTNDEDLIWLKNNSCPIKASLPDFMDSWFVGLFGTVPHKVVDSSKKTVGGYSMKWSLGLTMKVKNFEQAPVGLKPYINEKGIINNTSFLARLNLDHNFTIG